MDDFKHIKVNVCCHKAESPVYRIYVDDDLLTERTIAWPGYKTFIRENLICILEPGIHTLTIENCSKQGFFELSDFSLNENKDCVITTQADDTETGRIITFQVNP